MTLRRQLLIAISIIFVLVFAGLQTLSILSTKDFLQQQLSSHAQDAATSLSHTLVEPLVANDKVLAEIQIAAMFDRGYYRQIILIAPDGKQILAKELPVSIETCPCGFLLCYRLKHPQVRYLLPRVGSNWVSWLSLVSLHLPINIYGPRLSK